MTEIDSTFKTGRLTTREIEVDEDVCEPSD